MKHQPNNDMLLNEFIVEKELGRGGMGKVYLVRSQTTGRHFAIKEALVKDDSHRRAFLTELQTWIDLPDHPNILACRFFRTAGNETLIFADYVEGGSLADWIAHGKLHTLKQKLDVAIQFAWGLHAIHERGLVHQDVKPGNVLMTKDGVPKVADFGLARAKQRRVSGQGVMGTYATADNTLLVSSGGMTPAYASPEQRAGQALSSKTDIWSWAVSVMDMFLGELSCPFGGHIAGETLNEIVSTADDSGGEQIPEDVTEVLRRCFQTDPAKRWTSLAAVVDALRSVYLVATGKHHHKIFRPETPDEPREQDLPSHGQYSRSPEEWLAYADKLTGKAPRRTDRVAATARGSLVEAIRMMDDVVPVMEWSMDDARGDSIQRYFDALYVSADLHRRLADESGCLTKLRSAIQTLQRRDMTQLGVRLVLGDALHMYAVALREFKHLEEAVIAAREALCLLDSTARSSEHPYQTARCLQTLGTILSDKGDHVQALPAFQKAVELFDEYQESGTAFMLALALNNTGLCARKCGLHDLAISGYQRCIHIRESIVAVQPDDWNTKDQIAGTLGNLSSVLCDMGRKGEALATIDKAVSYRSKLCQANAEPELRVSLAKARHNRASVLFQMEQWGEAVNEYGHVVETVMPLLELEGRNDLRLLVKAATSSQDSAFRRIEERSMEEADALYTDIVPDERRAMAQCPGQWRGIMLSRLLSNWAGLKRALDQSGAAWLLLEEAIGVVEKSDQRIQLSEMTDGLVMFYRNLGALLIGIHAFIKAEEVCAKGREYCVEFGRVGKDTTFTENYCTLSLCLAHAMAAQGKTEQGATILNELNELVLELDDSMKCRISLLRAINDAHSNLKGLVLSGADPQLYFHSQRIAVEAQSQRQAGDFIGAARLYEKALELNQNDEALWINLSVIYAKMKRHQSAMRCCDRAARLNPGNGDTWLNRGLMLFEQQHFADAAASFDKAYELGIADAAAKASYCRDIVQGRI